MAPNLPAKRDSDAETLRKLKHYVLLRQQHKLFYEACKEADLKPATVRHWREKNPQFADAEREAAAEGVEQAEKVLKKKAIEDEDYQSLTKYLEANDPRYRKSTTTEHVLTVTLDAGNMLDRIRDLRHELARRQRDTPEVVLNESPWFRDDDIVDAEVISDT